MHTRTCARCIVGFLAVAVALPAAWYCWYRAVGTLRQKGRENVVASVQRGALRPDRGGVIRLPARWAWLSADRQVYEARDDRRPAALFFPDSDERYMVAWPDHQSERRRKAWGGVYSDRPLEEGTWLTLPGLDDVLVGDRIRPHWYAAAPWPS
jgi:hypothetical protein